MTDTLVMHESNWKSLYEKESILIRSNQKGNLLEIHHIGSTAISDIYAKPKIDMAVIVNDLDESKSLQDLGYELYGCLNIPFRYFFSKKSPELNAHLHVMLPEDPELEGFLMFRDYLNSHESVRKEYSELKCKIKDLLGKGHEKWLGEYTLAKNEFITLVLKKAGFNGFCMRLVAHQLERDYEKRVFNNFEESDVRVVFYKGPEIIGYANADRESKQVRFFKVSENENYFKNRFERYLETLQ